MTAVELALFSLFGSKVSDVTLAVLVNVVPGGVAGAMCITKVKSPLAPLGNVATLQVIVPADPIVGVKHVNVGDTLF